MRRPIRPGASPRNTLLALLMGALLAACASQQPAEEPIDSGTDVAPAEPVVYPALILPSTQYRSTFNAIENTLNDGGWMTAEIALSEIDSVALAPDDMAYYRYLQSRLAYLKGDQAVALSLLEAAEQAGRAESIRYRIHSFRHFILSLSGAHIEAARIALFMPAELPPEATRGWIRRAWLSLQRAETQELERAVATAREATAPDTELSADGERDVEWLGWLTLAQAARPDDSRLSLRLNQWKSSNPDHPANDTLPGGLASTQVNGSGPTRVALILPLSGRFAPAGRAVLDGFLAAHYMAGASALTTQALTVLDAGDFASAGDAYFEAVQQGAGVVIGPLKRPSVEAIAGLANRPVPVIGLNRIDAAVQPAGAPVIQMSLSPEDEAVTIAEAAFGNGLRSAMIIRPSGDRGDKAERALRARWNTLGGRIVDVTTYGEREQYSEAIKSAFNLDESESRASAVRDMLATNVEFTPRRRQDADVIFLLSNNSEEATALKPLLAFHYAGALPVYALSSVYGGVPDARNKDLNGINLAEIPWLLGSAPELRVAITAGDTGSDRLARLNALGADAYLLQARFSRMQSGADTVYRGATGLLTLDASLRILRELEVATFDGDTVRPM